MSSWRKMLRDLWLNKPRALLVVLAMVIGVFGVGLVADADAILTREMARNYMKTQPATATLWTDRVDADLISAVRAFPGIGDVQARRLVVGRVQVGADERKDLYLFVVDDYDDLRTDTFKHEAGKYPPATGEILFERVALQGARARIGQPVVVRIPGQPAHESLPVGTVHASGLPPAWIEGWVYGYVTRETLAELGGTPDLDQVKITLADPELPWTRTRFE